MEILIVKLGALGDVMRTTPLLPALKKKHPSSRITWVVDKANRAVLEGLPAIDRLWDFSADTLTRLKGESFDWAVNLDKEEEALDSILAAPAKTKLGFGRDPEGRLFPLSSESEYAYRLGIDDELKFRTNRKTYQQISFEQAGLKFAGEEYAFPMDDADRAWAASHLKALGVPAGRRVGLNTGSGTRFAGKKLPQATLAAVAEKLHDETGAAVLLLGGKDEEKPNRELAKACRVPVFETGSHPIRRFGALVAACDAVLTGDTTAMHVAAAVKTPAVVVFGATASSEIELYGRGEKIVSDLACAPCYKPVCPIGEACMEKMDAGTIFEALKRVL